MDQKKLEKTPSQPDFHAARVSAAALERKHSSGDLQSRLKTRKILGVGETDNGDVHRSKISQVLGHNEHLFVKFPRCYWLWHLCMAVYFTATGLTNVFTPIAKPDSSSQNENVVNSLQMTTTFYGSVLLGFAFLLWSFFGTTDKSLARGLMSAIVVTELAQLCAILSFAYQSNKRDPVQSEILMRLFLLLGSGYFFWGIGSSRAGLRRSLSNKDLRERQPTPEDQHHSPPSPLTKKVE